ncbi:hypothetical protein J3E72DRAFT_307885, partial [Bipolaris maydis]
MPRRSTGADRCVCVQGKLGLVSVSAFFLFFPLLHDDHLISHFHKLELAKGCIPTPLDGRVDDELPLFLVSIYVYVRSGVLSLVRVRNAF